MDWSVIWELIDPKLIGVVAACWVVGYILKSTPSFPDWTIVYVVVVVAVGLSVWMLGWSPDSVIQGILAGAFSVYGHQVIKQTRNARGSNVDK
ncbi:phage holin family protein [Neobacillus mesonae]|nr:phage holin family protein [Neobacillus mesonae]